MRVTTTIPEGFRGTARTIELMRRLTIAGVQSEPVRRLAVTICESVPRRDYMSEAAALLRWVQGNVAYRRDPWTPAGYERVAHPEVTLFETRAEDCDGLTVVYCALVGSIGHPWAFRTVGTTPGRPNDFHHVYALVWGDREKAWIAADPMFERELGWEPGEEMGAAVTAKRDWTA